MTSSNSIKLANKDLLLAIFVMFLWGANFSFIKLGLLELDSLVLAALRFLLCAVPLVFLLNIRKLIIRLFCHIAFCLVLDCGGYLTMQFRQGCLLVLHL
ncbi:EamA family transporter [Acinetobacter pittii]|nr:EamA family transporter [Acinetobacter pittii]